MSVIRKEIKKLVYLSAYFYKVSNFFFFGGGGGGGGWGVVGVLIYAESLPF